MPVSTAIIQGSKLSLINELSKRVRHDFKGWMIFTFKPELSLTGEQKDLIQPYEIHFALDIKNNVVTASIIMLDPDDIILTVPHVLSRMILDLKQGKTGTGNFLLEGIDFSSKDMIFNNQIRVYTNNFKDKQKYISAFKTLSIRLIINEFGDSIKPEKRSALIFGISDYEFGSKLKNPINDATWV